MTQMEAEFQAAKESALKQVEEYISSQYRGQETVDFRFDAFSMWGASNPSSAFWKNFPIDRPTDSWNRAVWSLNKADALAIAKHVECWNADWEYAIASRMYDGDPDDYRNAYSVGFSVASGTEHTIKAGAKGRDDAWQWN